MQAGQQADGLHAFCSMTKLWEAPQHESVRKIFRQHSLVVGTPAFSTLPRRGDRRLGMKTVKAVVTLALLCIWLNACGDNDEKSDSCSVTSTSVGVTIVCPDGTRGSVPRADILPDGGAASSCSVTSDGQHATISCSDGSGVKIPIGSSLDAGLNCEVTQQADGNIAIHCPDGTQAMVPGSDVAHSSLKLLGATAASCGGCHDSNANKAHFSVMTLEDDAGPTETCGTCHSEGSIKPVSQVHARPELGAPGLRVLLLAARIDPDTRKPIVRVQITDAAGAPLARETVSISFVLSKVESITPAAGGAPIPGAQRNYILRTATQVDTPSFPLAGNPPRVVQQPTAESSTMGTFVAGEAAGVYDYTFAFTLPVGYDAAATHVVALYATRTVQGVRFVSNAERTFVPNNVEDSGAARRIVRTETCNGCHNPLAEHGGSRQSLLLCVNCHTQGAIDAESGNTIDFNVLIHKIHMGKRLPSSLAGTPFQIIGNAASVHAWSDVLFPRPVENCQTCHTPTDGTRWYTNGTRQACVSCHENIDKPAAEGGHTFAIEANATCGSAECHSADGEGRDGQQAHLTSLNTPTAPTFDIALLSVDVDSADSAPSVRFRALTGTRAAPPADPVTSTDSFSMLDVFINGPNTGFLLNGNTLVHVPKAELVNLTAGEQPGEFSFSLPRSLSELVGALGDVSTDSFTLSLRAQFDPTPGAAPGNDRVDMLRNPAMAFSVSERLVTRTAVVKTDNCNKCHGELTRHEGVNLATSVEQCVMCHTGSFDTRSRQGANMVGGPTTSLRLATLVHRIHGGEIATGPLRVFGYAMSTPYPELDLAGFRFPGAARDCGTCHDTETDTNFLPLSELNPPSQTVVLDAEGAPIGL
jgi:OmcA/MtrC family decaheme c-type cytochrome